MPTRTSDAVEILHREYIGRPDRIKELESARLHAEIAQQVYDLRIQEGLTQRELADRVGTRPSVICRLEDADYGAHSLTMLERIAGAFGKRVKVTFEQRADLGSSPQVELSDSRQATAAASFAEQVPKSS